MQLVFRPFCKKVVLLISFLLLGAGIAVWILGNLEHRSYLAAFVLAVVLTVLLFVWRKQHNNKRQCSIPKLYHPVAICAVLSIICLLLNGVWVLMFHPMQAPDYQTFFQATCDLAEGLPLSGKDYLSLFPHILGYAAFLSMFLHIFGESILIAAIVNVLLTTGTGILIYVLSLRWTGEQSAAATAFLLWIICPSKLLYNTMVLSEPYYTFLLLLFFMLVSFSFDDTATTEQKSVSPQSKTVREKRAAFIKRLLFGILSGITAALINSARPIGLIPVIAVIIWVLFLSDNRPTGIWLKGVFLLLLLAAYLTTGHFWNSYVEKQLGQAPSSVPGYSIYVGFNAETQGSYADEDMELLQSRYFGECERNAEAAQKSMLESAKARILEEKSSIPSLMIHKLGTLLGHDEGGVFYSKESMSGIQYSFWCILSNTWYYFICFVSFIGCFELWKQSKREGDRCCWLIPLSIIGIVLAQLLVEVAARYHYCILPLLIIMAAFHFAQINQATSC